MATQVLEARDLGNDVLLVRGTVDGITEEDGVLRVVEATGWVSALSNHYDPSAYRTDEATGALARDPAAAPREMTAAEKLAYCNGLLEAQNPLPAAAPLPLGTVG